MHGKITTGEGGIIEDYSPDNCPNIADGLIVWEDGSHPYYFDLNAETPEVVDIYEEAPSEDYTVGSIGGSVRTDGRFLTWEERRDSWNHDGDTETSTINAYVIVAYDTEAEALLTVPAADWTQIRDTCYPRISYGMVVFAAEEYGVENSDYDKEIFYCDVTAETLELVQLTNDPNDDLETTEIDEAAGLWDSKPQVTDGLVVWRTGGSGSYWDWRGKSVAAAFID